MTATGFTTTLTLDESPVKVFNAINNVRGWWSEEIEGNTNQRGDIYLYHYKDIHYCKIELKEIIPGKKVLWQVLENFFSFIKDEKEWVGTQIIFEIQEKNGVTELTFTHQGLVPQYECYGVCEEAWTNYIQNSLQNLIKTGKGNPNPKEGEGYNTELARKWKLEP